LAVQRPAADREGGRDELCGDAAESKRSDQATSEQARKHAGQAEPEALSGEAAVLGSGAEGPERGLPENSHRGREEAERDDGLGGLAELAASR
jgi:hypothetical protein